MDPNLIAQFISNVGFPVACVLLCGYYIKYREDRNDEKYDKLLRQHEEETKSMTTALNNNTMALQRLADKLGDHFKMLEEWHDE